MNVAMPMCQKSPCAVGPPAMPWAQPAAQPAATPRAARGPRPAVAGANPGAPRMSMAPKGRLRYEGLSDTDRNFGVAIHLTAFACVIFGPLIFTPLVLWFIRKDKSAFVDDHGREVINFGISYFIYTLLLFWTILIPLALSIVAIVSLIRGAVAASNGEYFRYPLAIRFLS